MFWIPFLFNAGRPLIMTFIHLHTLQDNINMTVVLYPDYVAYRDSYCTGAQQLTFSHSCIKISCLAPSENDETLSFEWGVDDLVNVECQWFQNVSPDTILLGVCIFTYVWYWVYTVYYVVYIQAEFVMIKLRVLSKDAARDDDALGTSGQCTCTNYPLFYLVFACS